MLLFLFFNIRKKKVTIEHKLIEIYSYWKGNFSIHLSLRNKSVSTHKNSRLSSHTLIWNPVSLQCYESTMINSKHLHRKIQRHTENRHLTLCLRGSKNHSNPSLVNNYLLWPMLYTHIYYFYASHSTWLTSMARNWKLIESLTAAINE